MPIDKPDNASRPDGNPPRPIAPGRAAVRAQLQMHWGVVMAAVVSQIGDLERAENALQEAANAAQAAWSRDGQPESPRLWLLRVARRAAIDRYRRELRHRQKQDQIIRLSDTRVDRAGGGDESIPDQRWSLMLSCTHPSVPARVAQALLLRHVCGLDAACVARALMISEVALAQQMRRAQRSLRSQSGAFAPVPAAELPARRDRLLGVIHQLYRLGFDAQPEAERGSDPCELALWLAQLAGSHLPKDDEVQALIGLIGLHAACEGARFDAQGGWLSLEEQDPERWDQRRIHRTRMHIAALDPVAPGPFYRGACIAAEQIGALALSAPIDWLLILDHYRALYPLNPEPAVALGAAVALGRAEGPSVGLGALDQLAAQDGFRRSSNYLVARADMLDQAGRLSDALAALREAGGAPHLSPARRLGIERKIAELQARLRSRRSLSA